ncbi:MAG: hypothetical protein A3F90_05880 [Deltaproteobacteria bacterium RIFCSPLOWO2_12_FULL_60_19]|nr:MAG: hypothetical protein A3F90_05880 [Deltaproteobacteria bacterium RIFCSPLOWO2_12_FULL_60_19]
MNMLRFKASPVQYGLMLLGLLLLAPAAGFVSQQPWALSLWPWPERQLTYVFLGSIVAAVAAGLGRVGFAAEWGGLAAGALDLFITASGAAYFLFQMPAQKNQPDVQLHAWAALSIGLIGALLFVWAQRQPESDPSPTPPPVLISYGVFVVLLSFAGMALIMRESGILPWRLRAAFSSVLLGWIFIGNAFYFLYALIFPHWRNARAQLWSLLAFVMVMFPFYVAYVVEVFSAPRARRLSLAISLVAMIYSAALAACYLWPSRSAPPPGEGADASPG